MGRQAAGIRQEESRENPNHDPETGRFAETSSGTVAGWQESYVGKKGGYAAVRPKAGEFVEYGG